MRRVVSLFLPIWPIDRLRLRNAAAPDQPVLIVTQQGGRRLIMAVNPAAARLDLRVGMAVAQAQAMVPDLILIDADPAGDGAALARLAAWCLKRFSPLVAVCPPHGIWIDLTGCAHLFGGEAALLRHLVQRLSRAGITARAAIADTPGAAYALARYAGVPVTVVAPGQSAAAIAPLPVAALRVCDETIIGLGGMGLDCIDAVMRMPRAPLTRRFGPDVLRRLDQATGALPEPIAPMLAPDQPRARQRFADPISTPQDLARAIGLLAQSLCEILLRRGLGACRLDLICQRVDGAAQFFRIGTAAPCRDPAHMVRLLVARIDAIDPGFGIEAMLLAAPHTAPLAAQQHAAALGAEPPVADLAVLIDVLANRLGPENLFRLRPVESDLPERSQIRIPLATRWSGASWPDRLPRPTRLFAPPAPITTMALLPDHPPAQFTWRRHTHRIRRADGPERVFGEWWHASNETWAVRDYFQVEDESGQRFWLFRRGDGQDVATGDQQWFLHGVFG